MPTGGDGTAYYGEEVIGEKVMTKKDIKKRDEIADAISTKDMKAVSYTHLTLPTTPYV